MKIVIKIFLVLTLTLNLFGAEKKEDKSKLDMLALTALMIKDGFYARARVTIEQIDTTPKDFDFVRYYMLYGLLEQKTNNHPQAIGKFNLAIEHGQLDKSVYIYLMQSHYKIKDYVNTIIDIENGMPLTDKPKFYLLKSDCQWRLDEQEEAFATLSGASKKFPKAVEIYRQQFAYLSQLKLYNQALVYANLYLKNKADLSEQDYLLFGNSFRLAKELKTAINLLEIAKMKFPKSPKVALVLANCYMDQENIFAAAELFYQASFYNQALSKEAAELYKQSSALYQSLNANAKILDQKEKLKQRLSILLELASFEGAAGMEYALAREELMDNEDIRYAIAYSYYMAHDFERAEYHLKRLKRSDLFVKASELRKNMDKCTKNILECE